MLCIKICLIKIYRLHKTYNPVSKAGTILFNNTDFFIISISALAKSLNSVALGSITPSFATLDRAFAQAPRLSIDFLKDVQGFTKMHLDLFL